MSRETKKSAAEKRIEKEKAARKKQCRYVEMERDRRREIAERAFRHKPYGIGEQYEQLIYYIDDMRNNCVYIYLWSYYMDVRRREKKNENRGLYI